MLSRRDALIFVAAAALTATSPAKPVPAAAEALTKASLRLKWLPQAQFAGYYLALDKGYYRDGGLDLTINPGGPNLLTENLVATGADTFGVSGGTESVLAARVKGLPIVCVGIGHQITPFVFIARKDGPIKTIEDVPNHKVTAWFTGSQLVFAAILASKGVDPKSVAIAPQQVSFTPFVNGDVDVVTGTRYADLALLRRRMGADTLRVFDPESFGISIPRDTLIVSETTAKEKPELVKAFLLATIRGWQEARRDPKAAIDAVMKVAPTLERPVEEETLVEILKIMSAGPASSNGLYWIDPEVVHKTHDFLVEHKALEQPVDLKAAFLPDFLTAIPLAQRMP
jgi:NitT/TauT family transport system substrate-binding protein